MPDRSWQERIQFDLSCLSDPGTTVECESDKRRLIAEWAMRGERRQAEFVHSLDSGVRVEDSGQDKPYRSFLAEAADLRHVAQMISQSFSPRYYVDSKATREGEEECSAVALLEGLVNEDRLDRTRVIMLKGDAGAGKTQVLRQLVGRQAEAFLRGQVKKILLYVNAQGRALARLDEALAVALQDLRAGITYHAVPSLSTWDLMVPVIDGFDELLGVSGYEDAFSSLGEFLERLHGEGQLLASARSAYYEEQFLSRTDSLARNGKQAWSHEPVEMKPWSQDDCRKYFALRMDGKSNTDSGVNTEKVERDVFQLVAQEPELATKPLFFTRTVDLVLEHPDFELGDDLLGTLVDGYVERERREKLLDRRGEPLLSGSDVIRILRETAQEMWTVQVRELDADQVRLVAELVLEDIGVRHESQQVVVQRAPAMAFLTSSDTARAGVTFEHETFFFDFLARSLAEDYLKDVSANLRATLGASALPQEVADRAAFHFRVATSGQATGRLTALLHRLSEAGRAKSLRQEQVRDNAGRLVLAMLPELACDGTIERQEIAYVTLPGGSLDNLVFRRCAFRDVVMRRTSLANVCFEECTAERVTLIEPRMTRNGTRIGVQGLDPEHDIVGIHAADSDQLIYAPDKVLEYLADCGLDNKNRANRRLAPEFGDLMERLMRAYRKSNPVCVEDPNMKRVIEDVRWPTLRRALVKHGIVTEENRPTGGRPKSFLRRQFLPEQIMAGAGGRKDMDSAVVGFWTELTNLSG